MKKTILEKLGDIEKAFGVRIIHACESGSRAWGFPSRDSDYDVRFIYVHRKEWYLSVTEKKDSVESVVNEELDISGWDLRKSLRLLQKSNPPLLEWLASPVVYKSVDAAMGPYKALSKKAFLPESSCHHYLSMARNSMAGFDEGGGAVRAKKYLYALRTVLCAEWIIGRTCAPPVFVGDLLAELIPDGEIRRYVDLLILKKADGTESAFVERSADFENWLTSKSGALMSNIPKNSRKEPVESFDVLFRKILDLTIVH